MVVVLRCAYGYVGAVVAVVAVVAVAAVVGVVAFVVVLLGDADLPHGDINLLLGLRRSLIVLVMEGGHKMPQSPGVLLPI
jgi:hypothetical protein